MFQAPVVGPGKGCDPLAMSQAPVIGLGKGCAPLSMSQASVLGPGKGYDPLASIRLEETYEQGHVVFQMPWVTILQSYRLTWWAGTNENNICGNQRMLGGFPPH